VFGNIIVKFFVLQHCFEICELHLHCNKNKNNDNNNQTKLIM